MSSDKNTLYYKGLCYRHRQYHADFGHPEECTCLNPDFGAGYVIDHASSGVGTNKYKEEYSRIPSSVRSPVENREIDDDDDEDDDAFDWEVCDACDNYKHGIHYSTPYFYGQCIFCIFDGTNEFWYEDDSLDESIDSFSDLNRFFAAAALREFPIYPLNMDGLGEWEHTIISMHIAYCEMYKLIKPAIYEEFESSQVEYSDESE